MLSTDVEAVVTTQPIAPTPQSALSFNPPPHLPTTFPLNTEYYDSVEVVMIQHSTQPARGRSRQARRQWAFISVATIVVAVASMWLITTSAEGSVSHPRFTTPVAFARLADIPSHNRLYRATMIPSPDPIALDRTLSWTVEVRTAAGTPVEGAVLELESWMPDSEGVSAPRPRVTANEGAGRYRIDGLRFDRRGWWNVKLRISAPAGTDSLAFNLIL